MSRHHIESFWKIGRTALGTEHQPTCIANMFLQVQKQEILPKNSSFWKTLQNSSSKIPICLQFSFAHVSHIWRLQPRHRMKKKLVKTCCLMRKSSLKQWRRLQVAVNIDQQNDAVSDSCFVSRAALLSGIAFCSWSAQWNVQISWHCCLNEGKSSKSTWNLLLGPVRFLWGGHFSTWKLLK